MNLNSFYLHVVTSNYNLHIIEENAFSLVIQKLIEFLFQKKFQKFVEMHYMIAISFKSLKFHKIKKNFFNLLEKKKKKKKKELKYKNNKFLF